MARREVIVTIPGRPTDQAGERDNGKTFLIKEMFADEGEKWAMQALYLMWAARVDFNKDDPPPPETETGGMIDLAKRGIDLNDLRIARILQDPTLDEATWRCVQYVHDPKLSPQPIRVGAECQIEELKTRLRLRVEVLKLHLSFFTREKASPSAPSRSPPV